MRPRTRFWLSSIAALFIVSFLVAFRPIQRPAHKQWPDQAFIFDTGTKLKGQKKVEGKDVKQQIIDALVDGGFEEANVSVKLLGNQRVRVSTLPLSKDQAKAHKDKALKALKEKFDKVTFVQQVNLSGEDEDATEPIFKLGNFIGVYPPQLDVKLGLDLQGGMHVVLRCLPRTSMTFLTAEDGSEPLYTSETEQAEEEEGDAEEDKAEGAEAEKEKAKKADEGETKAAEDDTEGEQEPEAETGAEEASEADKAEAEGTETASEKPEDVLSEKELERRIRNKLVREGLTTPAKLEVKAVAPNRLIINTQAPDKQAAKDQQQTALNFLQNLYPDYESIEPEDLTVIPIRSNTAEKVKTIIDRRLYAMSAIREPVIQKQGNDQIIVQLPGVKDPERVTDILKSTAMLEFRLIPKKYTAPGAGQDMYDTWEDKNTGETLDWERVLAESKAMFRGEDLKPNSKVQSARVPGEWVVTFELKPKKKRAFHKFTRRNVGRLMAIVLDNECQMAPAIRSPIPGEGIIEGHFTAQEAGDLKLLLNAGALPVPLEIAENRTVSATLGADIIKHSLSAALIGLAVVLVFMVAYYRLPGLLASFALVLYIMLLLAVIAASKSLAGIGTITLTLPGIAGIILSLGMAVDANIIIFERLKEELWSGKSMRRAVAAGFDRAWTAILDANVTTLIITIVLYFLGTSLIKSFATTLIVGILCSLFTAVTVTRWLVSMVGETETGRNMSLYGIAAEDRGQ